MRTIPARVRCLLPALAMLALPAGCDCGGEVQSARPAIDVRPSSVDLGGVGMGSSAVQRVEVRSAGNAPLSVQSTDLARPDDAIRVDASLSTDCRGMPRMGGALLPVGECGLVILTFRPAAVGPVQNVLRISSDDPKRPVVEVELIGEGLAPALELCTGFSDGDGASDGATDGGTDSGGPGAEGSCTRWSDTPPFVPGLDFGEVPRRESAVKQARIRNSGRGALRVIAVTLAPGSDAFALPSPDFAPTVEPGGLADLDVSFTPPERGSFTGTLLLQTDDPEHASVEVPLSGRGTGPSVTLCVVGSDGAVVESACTDFSGTSPRIPTLDFGDVARRTTATATLRVLNRGRASLQVLSATLLPGSDGFGVPATFTSTIPADGQVDLPVTFTPPERSPYAGTVRIDTDDPDHPRVDVPLAGTGVGPSMLLCIVAADGSVPAGACTDFNASPPTMPVLDFGQVTRRGSVTRWVRVRNVGRAPLHVASAALEDPAGVFHISRTFTLDIDPGQFADLVTRFSPATRGIFNGKVTVASDDPDHASLEVILLGTGVAPAIRVCVPTATGAIDEAACSRLDDPTPFVPALILGSLPPGTRGTGRLRVLDTGGAPLSVSAVEVTVGAPAVTAATTVTLPAAVEPAGSLDIDVSATPQAVGPLAGTVRIASDDDAHPQVEVRIAAEGAAPQVRACVLRADGSEDPTTCSELRAPTPFVPTLDFGHLPWGLQRARVVRVYDIGGAPMTLRGANLVSATGELAIGTGSEPGYLQPTQYRDLELLFHPTATDGAIAAGLHLLTDDAHDPDAVIPVRGWGDGPALCVSPASLDFGTVPVGDDATQHVTLTNCGPVSYNLNSLAISGASEFSSALHAVPASMDPGAELGLDVRYAPSRQRTDTGTLAVATTYASQSVSLRGTGGAPTCSSSPATASISTTPATPAPLQDATLDGRASSSPRGSLSYAWRLVSQPTNGTSGIVNPSSAQARLYAQLAGDYTVRLTVTDTAGCQGSATKVIHVVPNRTLHVQLTWPEDHDDVDLHYLRSGAALYSKPGDVFWNNKTPDWGLGGNNPTLDIDDQWGFGPENVNQSSPANGTYYVKVHNYCNRLCHEECHESCILWICTTRCSMVCDGTHGPSVPLLKVYVDGSLRWQQSSPRALEQQDVWDAAKVVVNSGTYTVSADTGRVWSGAGTYPACSADTD